MNAPESSPLRPRWGVAPRHGFRPPRLSLWPFAADRADPWAAIPPVLLLTDLHGEELPNPRAAIKLAWDAQALHLRAVVTENNAVLKPDVAPEDARFWTQDHLELRLLLDPADPFAQAQFILTPGGRCFANQERLLEPGVLSFKGVHQPAAWEVELALPWAVLGRAAPAAGETIAGLVAHVRWAEGFAEIATATPCPLGFSQVENFAEFVVRPALPPVRLTGLHFAESPLLAGPNPVTLVVENAGTTEFAGRLFIHQDHGTGAGASVNLALRLPPGQARLPLTLELERPRYTRYRFAVADGMAQTELASVTLRAGVPPLNPADLPLQHPYLLFPPAVLEELARKAANPAFAPYVAALQSRLADVEPLDLDKTPLTLDFDLEQQAASYHVCASLVRGRDAKTPGPARRCWELLPTPARAAAQVIAGLGQHPTLEDVRRANPNRLAVVDGLNALLANTELYTRADFRDVPLPPDIAVLRARGPANLAPTELRLLNRYLLEAGHSHYLYAANGHLLHRIIRCFRLWLLSRDARLVQIATDCARAAARFTTVPAVTNLHAGGQSLWLGLAFDTFHPHLTEADRQAWLPLLGRFLYLHRNTARRRGWDCTAIPNANPVCNGGGGVLALATLAEIPEAAESLAFARKFIWNHLDYCYGPNGGNTEGAQYLEYGMSHFLRFACALEAVLGQDDGLLAQPAVPNISRMLRLCLENDGKMHGVNDTIPLPIDGEIACFLAGRYNDPFALWWSTKAPAVFADMQRRGKPTAGQSEPVFCLLFRPDVPALAAPPPLELADTLPDLDYSVLRSGTNYDCALVAGLKGSRPPYTHHNQPDTGSFFLSVRGERLLIDPGYYQPKPTDHCLPIIGGVGPAEPRGWVGELVACRVAGDCRYVAADSTAAYAGAAGRVRRHLVMVGAEALVVLDDIAPPPGKKTVRVHTWLQGGGPTRDLAAGRMVEIAGESARVRVELLTRPALKLKLHPERSLKVNWGYHFAECRWFPLSGEYDTDEQDPLVLVALDSTAGASPKACAIARAPREFSLTLPSGALVRFAFASGRWQWEE